MAEQKKAESKQGGNGSLRWTNRHLFAGWLGLAVFTLMGLGLETMHGLKLGYYLDLRNETRRMLWTLAHSHGTLLSVVNLAAAFTLLQRTPNASWPWLSCSLLLAQWLLPIGFLLGGLWLHGGDPHLSILFVPFGGLLLLFGASLAVYNVMRSDHPTDLPSTGKDRVSSTSHKSS